VAGHDEVASAAVGPPRGAQVRLSSNESPFGPSPAVRQVLEQEAAEAHRYPDDQSLALRGALSDREGVATDRIACGTGSAGLLMDLIAHETRGREEGPVGAGVPPEVLTYQRAFIVYRLGAQVGGAELVEAPLGDGYSRDPQALLDLLSERTRIVCIDNPGNPTGRHLTGAEVRALVEAVPEHVTVVLDEAYHHFASGHGGYDTAASLGLDHPRLVVLRTFSKAYALAALRVGYAIGPADLIASVDAWRVRFNVNAMAQAAAIAALEDEEHLARTVEGTVAGRVRMSDGLATLGIRSVDGLGNFLLVELGQPAAPIVEAYASHGIGVRALVPYGLHEQIRVTVGTPGEVEAFLAASEQVLAEVPSGAS
jgi:histidinol-phosphate aminotransferase